VIAWELMKRKFGTKARDDTEGDKNLGSLGLPLCAGETIGSEWL
jgi:hypothetical protein